MNNFILQLFVAFAGGYLIGIAGGLYGVPYPPLFVGAFLFGVYVPPALFPRKDKNEPKSK